MILALFCGDHVNLANRALNFPSKPAVNRKPLVHTILRKLKKLYESSVDLIARLSHDFQGR